MAADIRGQFETLQASADFIGNGAIEINKYEAEIVDMVRRSGPFRERMDAVPATGHPHRYFEQTAIATGQFSDPRTIASTPSGPTRVERSAMIKAITARTQLSLFDIDVTRQQGNFASLEAKDIQDIINATLLTAAPAFWAGTDTSLSTPTTIQYMGLLAQITQQFVISPGASIVDGLKTAVANMVANTTFNPRPTAIWLNPILGDLIDKEAKAGQITLADVTVTVGVVVKGIQTQAGVLPLIPDPFMPITAAATAAYGFAAPPAGIRSHYAVILTEKMVERPFIHGGDGNPNPRLFQLGLVANLQADYIAVNFDTVIAKGPSYNHAVVQVQRP